MQKHRSQTAGWSVRRYSLRVSWRGLNPPRNNLWITVQQNWSISVIKLIRELRSSPLCPRFCYAVLGVQCHNWILLQVKGNSNEPPWKKNTDQKIEMLLCYSLTLSSRTDETVNSVAIYELSAAVYVKKREVQWLS